MDGKSVKAITIENCDAYDLVNPATETIVPEHLAWSNECYIANKAFNWRWFLK